MIDIIWIQTNKNNLLVRKQNLFQLRTWHILTEMVHIIHGKFKMYIQLQEN